jgi:hypothetical protein
MSRIAMGKVATAAGVALLVSMWSGAVKADEEFHTVAGIPTETLSHNEMAAVEGKDAIGFLFTPKAGGEVFKTVKSRKNGPLILIDTQSGTAVGILDPKAGNLSLPPSSSKNPLLLIDLGRGVDLGA